MARIRTIKPEFVQSETIGKLSRDARLLFIQLWTFVDDHGRSRGNSRLLAANLYPYDEDAAGLIDGWLDELEGGAFIRRYVFDDITYLDIPKWASHQRIDNAGKSRIPEFIAATRGDPPRPAAENCDPPLYLGPRTLDQGPRIKKEDSTGADAPVADEPKKSKRGTRLEAGAILSDCDLEFATGLGFSEPDSRTGWAEFVDYWAAIPGQRGTKLDWSATWRNRIRELAGRRARAGPRANFVPTLKEVKDQNWEDMRAKLRTSITRDRESEADGGSSVRLLSEGSGRGS